MRGVQLWTGKASLGDAMLCTLHQLPRVQWMITTLGKQGSVLIERQQSKHQIGAIALEDKLNSMLREVARSNSSKHNNHANEEAVGCTSKSSVHIRFGRHASGTVSFLMYERYANTVVKTKACL